jgi:predicted site-specific integrase-resolvase
MYFSHMKLTDWAKENGLTYVTAWRLFRDGNLPVRATQLATGTILVHPEKAAPGGVALYARVSGSDQRADLERQLGRLSLYGVRNGLQVTKAVSEIGSGLNGGRRKLMQLLADPDISTIVVEHRDRLARFGSEYIEGAMAASGRRVIIVEETETTDDLVQDMIEVMTSLCARLYGRRSVKNRAARALAAAQEGGPDLPETADADG